ncbi:odorant receptor 63a-like [Ochlerotatus camptorhynchus]|uniref:odorant receptor 63a-like n=1 Tax=Ochlerotatus camptorhynchus TaxID=644619 RepID=UPI0031CEB50C
MFVLRKFISPKPELLSFGLQMLRLIGLWGDRRNVFRYLLAILCMLVVLIGPKAVLGSGKEGFDSTARNVAELIFLIEVCVSIGIFATRRASFERMVDVLERILQRDWPRELQDEIDRFHRKMELFARIYAVYIGFLVLLYLGAPIVSTAVKMICVDEVERSDFMLIIEVQFYWLDIRRNFVHYTIYMVFCVAAVVCSAYQSALKGSVILVTIQYGTKLFEIVTGRITKMAQTKKVDDRRSELRQIVELHNLALEYVEHLEATVSFILINQILNCILIWCLMMFYVSTNFGPNAANVILLFVVLMGEMVVYCVNGTILSEKALGVAHAMYDYPWYTESVAMQKDIKMIIQRAQIPTGITAAKFYYVNIERLGLVIQASYSYYLILKERF